MPQKLLLAFTVMLILGAGCVSTTKSSKMPISQVDSEPGIPTQPHATIIDPASPSNTPVDNDIKRSAVRHQAPRAFDSNPPPGSVTFAGAYKQWRDLSPDEQEQLLVFYTHNFFSKKLIPFEYIGGDGLYNNDSFLVGTAFEKDCFTLTGGKTMGGDIISTILNDERARVDIEDMTNEDEAGYMGVYTPDYLAALYSKLADYTQHKYQKSIYAYLVCHLAPELDIVAGTLWSPSSSPYYYNAQTKKIDTLPAFSETAKILLMSTGSVAEFSQLPISHSEHSIGDRSCDAQWKADHVEWSCFTGYKHCMGTDNQAAEYHYWSLHLNGTKSAMQIRYKPSCEDQKNAVNRPSHSR